MRRFLGDKMPHRDENGRKERVVNYGMQDPRIVCGFPVRIDEIALPNASEAITPEAIVEPAQATEAVINPVRAIHNIAIASGLELRPNSSL